MSKESRIRSRSRHQILFLVLVGTLCLAGWRYATHYLGRYEITFANAHGGPTGRVWVEAALNDEERSRGLMFRRSLPADEGMIFVFKEDQEHSFWMKNTYISLDMIFIRADGRILRIAENTEPLSTRIISSGGLAKGVLEVIAGTAQKYGIQPGDRVAHPLFNSK